MPHRKNAKGDIGTAKKFSDSYDMDNIYLTEEGWVYRHFKNTERTLWWDEIIVAGQVKPDMSIHGVSNGPGVEQGSGRGVAEVVLTNPLKLGTVTVPSFQQGDGVFDYRYSNHVGEDIDDDATIVTEDPVFDDDQSGGGADHGNPDDSFPGALIPLHLLHNKRKSVLSPFLVPELSIRTTPKLYLECKWW